MLCKLERGALGNMSNRLNIAVVGCGKVGRALGSFAAARGHIVHFSSRRAASAREAAEQSGNGARAMEVTEAVIASEIVLLTTPFDSVVEALDGARAHTPGKVLIDVTNPLTPDHRDLAIGHSSSGAEHLASAHPGAFVVKAFNAVFAEIYATRTTQLSHDPISIFYAGDDADAKKLVRRLIASLGFDPVDAGTLHNARYLEPLSLLNIHLGKSLGYGTMIGFALTRARD